MTTLAIINERCNAAMILCTFNDDFQI